MLLKTNLLQTNHNSVYIIQCLADTNAMYIEVFFFKCPDMHLLIYLKKESVLNGPMNFLLC